MPESRASFRVSALAAACSLAFGLAGCRTAPIGEPLAIRIPANLSEEQAQDLVTELIEGSGKNTSARGVDSASRKIRENWQIEQWEPGFMTAAYSWRSHVLRVNLEFADRTVLLEIGDSENLRQSSQRIHKVGKKLASKLAKDIRLQFSEAAPPQRRRASVASQGSESEPSSFCSSTWKGDIQEQASCQRAQRRSYDRLRPLIAKVKARPTARESKRLKACYAGAQTWAGADWEAIERCFYAPPASAQ